MTDPATVEHVRRIQLHMRPWGVGPRALLDYRWDCGRFSRTWAGSVCRDAASPVGLALPQGFALADARHLEMFSDRRTIGGETVGDHLRAMTLVPGRTAIRCDATYGTSAGGRCTAAIPLTADLVAVWGVWDSMSETRQQMAEREGQMIRALVAHGLGPAEAYAELLAVACAHRNPIRSARIGQDHFRKTCKG